MRIETKLPHELEKGGFTVIMFAKPEIRKGLSPCVLVDFSIIKTTEDDKGRYICSYIQCKLKDEHRKKIIAYAKKLAAAHIAQDKKYKIVPTKRLKNADADLKEIFKDNMHIGGRGNRCCFSLVKL